MVRMMPAITAAARMMFAGILWVMGRGDVPADEAADAQHDGGRPIDRALDDELPLRR